MGLPPLYPFLPAENRHADARRHLGFWQYLTVIYQTTAGTLSAGRLTVNRLLQTANYELRTAHCEPPTGYCQSPTENFPLGYALCRLEILNFTFEYLRNDSYFYVILFGSITMKLIFLIHSFCLRSSKCGLV